MTNEEARKYILANWFDGENDVNATEGNEETESMKQAVFALEKQMPKRVNNTQNLRIFRCPSCNIEIVILGASHRFCENCGQAIDCGEDNDK